MQFVILSACDVRWADLQTPLKEGTNQMMCVSLGDIVGFGAGLGYCGYALLLRGASYPVPLTREGVDLIEKALRMEMTNQFRTREDVAAYYEWLKEEAEKSKAPRSTPAFEQQRTRGREFL